MLILILCAELLFQRLVTQERCRHGRVAVLTSSLQLKHHHVLYGNMNELLHLCAHILLGHDTSIQLRDAENELTHFLGAVQAASAVSTF